MKIGGALRPGRRTFAVNFADQTVHGNVPGHDVHLARIDENIELEELGTWTNWIVGLDDPAPAEFLGGAHDLPAGHTAYVSSQLTAGRYALIAEVDHPTGRTCCAFSASRTRRATRVGSRPRSGGTRKAIDPRRGRWTLLRGQGGKPC